MVRHQNDTTPTEENKELTLNFIYEQIGKKRFRETGLRKSKFSLIKEWLSNNRGNKHNANT